MKCAIYAFTVLMLTCGHCAVSHAQTEIGTIHRIDIKAIHPKAYHPKIGDVVQCYINFTVVPGQIIEDLEITTAGKSIAVVGVVNTKPPNIVGADQISVFLIPRQAGLSKLTVKPVIANVATKPFEMNFLIYLPKQK